jgi:hypothetical protein
VPGLHSIQVWRLHLSQVELRTILFGLDKTCSSLTGNTQNIVSMDHKWHESMCIMISRTYVAFLVPVVHRDRLGKWILGPDRATGVRLLSFNRTQSRIVIGLVTGHNTLRRHLYIMGLCNHPICRKCGTEEETSVHILCVCVCVYGHHLELCYNLVQNMGHKGPVLRPRCIGPRRARTQTLFYSILFYSILGSFSNVSSPYCICNVCKM